MTNEDLHHLKFPIGEFSTPDYIPTSLILSWIAIIEDFPATIMSLTKDLNSTEKNWLYRPKGWSVKQVVHHCADSHMNAFIRFKLSLTEDTPSIRPYYEDKWAELIDSTTDNLESSIMLITGLHSKWVHVLKNLDNSDYEKEFMHPEHGTKFRLDECIGTYAWHCEHHLAHIKQALEAKGSY